MDRTDTMRRARILRWASLSAALAACAAALAAVSLTGWSLFQPDTRYMVAIGRWIIETGELPTSDPLTLHEGLAYICQQWPLCIAAAGFAMAQLHGALWTVALMVPCCLMLDGRLDRHGRLKALTAAMSTLAACMLNPYGARLLMVPFATMSAESLKSVGIGELAPWIDAAPAQAAAACTLAAALLLYRLRVRRRGGGRALLEAGDLLVLGTLMLSLANVRNELFLMTSMALALSDIQGEVAGPCVRSPIAPAACCTAALLASLGLLAATVPSQTPIEASAARAMAALESSGAEPGDAVICDIDVGSELELAGYRPLLDTRAELFCPELNGGADAWGTARHVLAGDEDAIEGTGADFAAVPSGAYPALEDSLSGLGFPLVHDDGTFAVFARKPS